MLYLQFAWEYRCDTVLHLRFAWEYRCDTVLYLQFAWDITNTTVAGQLDQGIIATGSPNFPDPAERVIEALLNTAATVADPTLAAPPNGSAPVCLQSQRDLSVCHMQGCPVISL